ncbi:MAG: hypothetical protein GY814_14380 [Gammaproteobacteria bacterium]|nr:hypothetical protein [Gammaproteobacteria bacterium]
MSRYTTILIITILLILVMIDPALAANKFTRIGGGVSGSSTEKLQVLKEIGGIFGGFLILLGIASFLTRGRFEGLVGMVTGERFEAITVIPIILIILGVLMVTIYFI